MPSSTGALKVGRAFDKLNIRPLNKSPVMTAAPKEVGGDYPEVISVDFAGNYSKMPTVCMRSDLPFGATICALSVREGVDD